MAHDSAVDEIKARINIADYIGNFVTLKKAGRNFKGICPFHNENTPSFVVSPERQIWRCFGACGEGGDVISFLMKWDNLTFSEAIKELAEQAGVKLDTSKFEDRNWQQKEKLLKINAFAAKYFHYLLTQHESGKECLTYVKDRGLNDKILETFQLGYAPKSWRSLLNFLKKKGFSDKDVVEAGLALQSQKNSSSYYDRFRGRLMFPFIDTRGNITGFTGRVLDASKKEAKYVNTPETPVYHKRKSLYGIHIAADAIRKEKKVVIVEGQFDMISSFKHDIKNTVAINGTSFTDEQLNYLKRLTDHLVLALDADFAGASAALRSIKKADQLDFRMDVIPFKEGKDPDEALEADPIAFKKLLKKPVPIYDFIIDTALETHNVKDPYEKKKIVDDVLPFLQGISNPIVKSHYTKRLASVVGTDERDIESSLRRLSYTQRTKRTSVPTRKAEEKKNRYEVLQKYVLSYTLQHEKPLKTFEQVSEILDTQTFSIPSLREIFEALSSYKSRTFDLDMFAQNFSDPIQSVLDELYLTDIGIHDDDTDNQDRKFKKTLYELKRLAIKDTLKKDIADNKTSDSIQALTRELTQVEKALSIL